MSRMLRGKGAHARVSLPLGRAPLRAAAASPPASPPPAEELLVELGGGKSLRLLRPADLEEHSPSPSLYGAGDVVWPASVALARLLRFCPSFVSGRRVLELGPGLGLVSCAAAAAGASSILLADRDEATLSLAARSVGLNAPHVPCTTAVADWGKPDDACWPNDIDVVLCSDILYDEFCAVSVATLLGRLLRDASSPVVPRAIVADAPQRLWRHAFEAAASRAGLVVQTTLLPGPEGTILMNVLRQEA